MINIAFTLIGLKMILSEYKNLTLIDNERFILYDGTTIGGRIKHLDSEYLTSHDEVSKAKHWYCSLRIRLIKFSTPNTSLPVTCNLLVINKKGTIKKIVYLGGVDTRSHFETEIIKIKKKHKLIMYVSGDSVLADLKLHAF